MLIQIEMRNVYGEMKAYPVNAAACHLAAIAGTKTLVARALDHALGMGCTVEIIGRRAVTIRPDESGQLYRLGEAFAA